MLDAAMLWSLANPSGEERALALAERELIGFRLDFAKASGKRWEDTPSASWMCTGSKDPSYNSVVRARLTPETAGPAVRELLSRFEGLPMRWMAPPSAAPRDVGELLRDHGFEPEESQTLMVAELNRISAPELPDGLTYEEVLTPRRLYDWVAIAGHSAEKSEARFWAHLPLLMEAGASHRYFIVKHGEVPVARSMLRTTDGIAGLYGVHTGPRHRRCGFGAAATLHALKVAREAGLKLTSLQASEEGEPLYRKLGYRALGEVRCWIRP